MEQSIKARLIRVQLVRFIACIVVSLTALGSIGVYFYKHTSPAQAAANLNFSVIGTHPEAGAQSTAEGKKIRDIAIKDNKIYMAYGDYGDNTGPIHINPFNINTESFEGSKLSVPTEQISSFRTINNKLYAPMIDPKLAWTANVGYAEQALDGSWRNQFKAPAIHIFDMATMDGGDLWMVGSSVEADGTTRRGATAYRSTDGGDTWSIAGTDASEPTPSDYDRYYWIAELNGRVYMQLNTSMRSFDGSAWREETSDYWCHSQQANRVVVFADNIVCGGFFDGIGVFDGSVANRIYPTDMSTFQVEDFYIDGEYLYVLSYSGGVVRTKDLVSWENLGAVSGGSHSIAVYDDYLYTGSNNGELLRSDTTITESLSAEFVPNEELCFAFNATTNTITDYYDNQVNNAANPACPRAVDIPATIDGVAVTKVGNSAFFNNQLTSITIPDTVTSIGDWSFAGNQLTSITIPDTVTSIGGRAFTSNQLTSITIPSAVTSIGDWAFSSNQLTSATVVGDPATLGNDILSGNPLTSISYKKTIYTESSTTPEVCFSFSAGSITNYRQYDLNLIKSDGVACMSYDVDIPSTIDGAAVTKIGNHAFNGNQLTSVTIPSAVTSIGDYAFASNQLTSITIPNSVTSIGDRAFSFNQLTSITIPSAVTSIGDYAFASNQLTTLTIEGDLIDIGLGAFDTGSLKKISYNGEVVYDTSAPTGLISESCLDFEAGTIIGYLRTDNIMLAVVNGETICGKLSGHLTIPSTIGGVAVTKIGSNAFSSSQLTSVTIPNSVTSIGNSAFSGNQLTSITIEGELTEVGEHVLYGNPIETISYNGTVTHIDPEPESGPTTTDIVQEACLYGDSGIIYGYMTGLGPDLLSNIVNGTESAASCKPLSGDITIPATLGGEPVTGIDGYSFYLKNIRSVHLPDSVTSVGPMAFIAQGTSESNLDPTKIYYTRLYTNNADSPNINNSIYGGEGFNYGGHIINAAPLTVNYKTTSGTTLKPSQTYTGTLDGEYLTDYLAANGPEAPDITNPDGPNPEEQAAIDQALSAYYRLGDTVTITPPAIPGFVTPAAKTFTLSDPETVGSFIYQPIGGTDPTGPTNPKPLTKVDFSKPSGSTSNPTSGSVPASLPAAMANSTFTVDTSQACSTIDAAKLLPASNFKAPDADSTDYATLGGLDFTLSCTTPGEDAKVSLSLASEVSDPSTVKVYKKTADGKVTDITSQTTITSQNGKTTISYSLTDGGNLDDDGKVNGVITDPIYVTVPAGSELLAETGSSQWIILAVSGVMVVAGLVTLAVVGVRKLV